MKSVGVEAYSYYLKNSYEYAIVSSEAYGSFLMDNQVSRNFPSFKRFYKELFEKGNLIKEFSPKDGNRPGPVVKIFQLTVLVKHFHQQFPDTERYKSVSVYPRIV